MITFKGSPYIGEKVRLRPPEHSDLDAIMTHWNTYETRRFLNEFIPHSRAQEEKWIQSMIEAADKREAYAFIIEEQTTRELLGSVDVRAIDWIDRHALVGIAIYNPEKHGHGYGTDALRCLLRFCFHVLNLHRVELGVFEFNPRAKHVYEKVGFKEVGRRREDKWFEGKYYDHITMDILDRECK
jgi:RimJ/RimL family protein N-acetyltransferase